MKRGTNVSAVPNQNACEQQEWRIIIIIIIIIKKMLPVQGWESDLHPYQSEDPSPTIPTYREKEEKGKIVGDYTLWG